MDKAWLIRNVCAGFCCFYKPEKDEELACKGFLVLEDLTLRQDAIAANDREKLLRDDTMNDLYGMLCKTCPFFVDGCDFAAERRGEGTKSARQVSMPCGGILFLGVCLERGSIDIKALNGVI